MRATMAPGAGSKKTTSRRSAAETRTMVLATALDALEHDGLKLDLRALNMNDLIRNAGVSRSAVRRIWTSNKMFYLDLIEAMAEPERRRDAVLDEGTMRVADAVLTEYKHLRDSERGRRAVLREMIRQAVTHNFETNHRKLAWRTYAALTAALPSLIDENHQRARDILAAADARDTRLMAEFYQQMMNELGLRFRAGFDADIFATTASSLIGGLAMRRFISQSIPTTTRLPGVEGGPVDWHYAAAGFMAIIDGMTEPDSGLRN
ncbi:hypothetical protein [Nocardia sp. NPDC052566]|uniref:hypothetical protein n=1 Tax=Nocardia sp. NPDC052566 TaxID=3364330 RepID=UPI0037CA52DA